MYMIGKADYLDLLRQAQLGDQESLTDLTKLVEGKLYAHIYRLTLNRSLTEDLLQETLLEMVKSIKKLKFSHINQFWSWLFKVASSKVKLYFREQTRKRKLQMSISGNERFFSHRTSEDHNDGLKNLLHEELSQTIFKAMAKLKFRQRLVLVLRCYEQKPYSEIANIMDCSKLAVQVLFFRAKHSLKHQLSRGGFSKQMLLVALGLFGKLTTRADAATAAVTAASMKVGLTAAVIGVAGTKVAVVATATALTATALTLNITPEIKNSIISAKFVHPSSLVAAYDPDGNGFRGVIIKDRLRPAIVSVAPEKWLVGPPPQTKTAVILPAGHWVELKFPGYIVDGPGRDIILTELGEKNDQAQVFITDGTGNEYLLGLAKIRKPTSVSCFKSIGFDISTVSLPFVPRAVRIVGTDIEGGQIPPFALRRVRARVKKDNDTAAGDPNSKNPSNKRR